MKLSHDVITRDVITDLLPLYAAGEASADTRTLIEEFFREDPDFARRATAGGSAQFAGAPALQSEMKMRALARTKRQLRLRSLLLAFSIFFTLSPFSFSFGDAGFAWVYARQPQQIAALLVFAAAGWTGYFWLRHRLRGSGV